MKAYMMNKGIYSAICLLVLTSSAYTGHAVMKGAPAAVVTAPGKFYVGAFGGWGSASKFDVSQFGTAYYTEALGGPLAVDAFGNTSNRSVWLLGAQVGYQAPEILLDPCSQWALVPAAELEGYYLGTSSFSGHLINDEATRLPEHDFDVTYPMKRGVFLTNVVLNLNIPCIALHPYVGVGIGGAIVNVSGADASQLSPPEPGVNHYNSNSSDTASTFAGQIKAGLSYDISKCVSLFAEYRWLYLSSTHFSFGSTVYPGHPVTSNWQVKLDPQYYNMGTIGIRYSL